MFTRYVLPVLAAVALVFAVVQMTKAQQKPPEVSLPVEPAKSPYPTQLAGAGLVEPETENIAIGSHVPGIVEQVYVKVGQTVRPGQPLFRLDDRQLKAELEIRLANLANAEAAAEKQEQMPRKEEVPPAEAKVAEAKANLRDQVQLYDRYRKLSGTSAISEEEVTRKEMAAEIARTQVAKAEADLALLKAGAWRFDKLVAATAVKQARAQAEQTRVEIDRLTARTPRVLWADGGAAIPTDNTEFQVLQVNVRPGEYVGTVAGSPLMVLGRVGRLHVRVDIDENDIARFRPSLPGTAKPRGSADQAYPLTFVRVEPYVIPKKSLTGGNTERVDTRVLQVIYAIDSKDAALFVGQQMDVFLDTGRGK